MKKFLPFLLFLFIAAIVMGAPNSSSKSKRKKKHHKVKNQAEYNGPLLKIQDAKATDPVHAGFAVNGHYQFTVVETATPTIRFSGAEQPTVHICVEGSDYKNQQGRCIEELHNGYGNMVWDAAASTKSYITAYRPDGTAIQIKKDLFKKNKPATWKSNEITWEDGDYKVSIKIAKCKVEENGFCISPR